MADCNEIFALFAGDLTYQNIMECFIKLVKDISKDSRALGKLRREIEPLLDKVTSEKFKHSSEPLTIATSEEWKNLFIKTMVPVKKAMDDACLGKHKIDEVVIVGGSTRIPIVRQLLTDYLNGTEPDKGMNPDEAVQGRGEETNGKVLVPCCNAK